MPQVYWVLQRMNETGVDFHLDLHGDPRAEWVFTSGLEGVPGYDVRCAWYRVELPVPPAGLCAC